MPTTAKSSANGDTPPARSFSMNFDLVLQKIQDLNVLTGEGQRFIHKTASGAKLYRNGIEMFDGHFRSFQEQSTQLCMQDLVDDCFPSELQQRFPDGVPFETLRAGARQEARDLPGQA
uniref:UBX domain-containing protein 11 n=1 Tax=Nothobranchius furzeri TaxID=105023 RepID=A0A8C6PRG9_NOTFU